MTSPSFLVAICLSLGLRTVRLLARGSSFDLIRVRSTVMKASGQSNCLREKVWLSESRRLLARVAPTSLTLCRPQMTRFLTFVDTFRHRVVESSRPVQFAGPKGPARKLHGAFLLLKIFQ